MERNVKLTLKYDGTRYFGWEHQPGQPMTIQGKLERVVARMLGMDEGETPQIIGAGRTDAGVHARAMVANFHANTEMTEDEILAYMNRYLPEDIGVDCVQFASPRFHARYNAVGKLYVYSLWCGPRKPVFDRKFYTYVGERLDVARMREAAGLLTGTRDFRAFCANPRMKKSTVRTVDVITIQERRDVIRLSFHGNGFLQNMVRIMVGTLMEVGVGRREPDDMTRILDSLDRQEAGPTAAPEGLCLMRVEY